jgi:hypothetical protein
MVTVWESSRFQELRREAAEQSIRLAELALRKLSDRDIERLITAIRNMERELYSPRSGVDDADLMELVVGFMIDRAIFEPYARSSRQKLEANGGHDLTLSFDTSREQWVVVCACRPKGEDDALGYFSTRDEAIAEMTSHMFQNRLKWDAVDSIWTEQDVEAHKARLAYYGIKD